MADFKFNPALPLPIKFQLKDGQYGNQLTLFIPVESITHLMEYLQNLVDTKSAGGSVYVSKEKGTVKTTGVYINSKAFDGDDGFFGNINPHKIENAPNTDELPF